MGGYWRSTMSAVSPSTTAVGSGIDRLSRPRRGHRRRCARRGSGRTAHEAPRETHPAGRVWGLVPNVNSRGVVDDEPIRGIDDPEVSGGVPGHPDNPPELARPAARSAEGAHVRAAGVEYPDLRGLRVCDVDPAEVVDLEIHERAEQLGTRAIGRPDRELGFEPPRRALLPDPDRRIADDHRPARQRIDGDQGAGSMPAPRPSHPAKAAATSTALAVPGIFICDHLPSSADGKSDPGVEEKDRARAAGEPVIATFGSDGQRRLAWGEVDAGPS